MGKDLSAAYAARKHTAKRMSEGGMPDDVSLKEQSGDDAPTGMQPTIDLSSIAKQIMAKRIGMAMGGEVEEEESVSPNYIQGANEESEEDLDNLDDAEESRKEIVNRVMQSFKKR